MAKHTILTHEYLLSILDYNPETGIFINRIRRGPSIAGQIAGTYKNPDGYVRIKINKIDYRAHHLAWFYIYEEWPAMDVDHIDNNSHNNSINNLRLATGSQNKANSRKYKNNISGYKGVHFDRISCKYRASIRINGRLMHLGMFNDLEKAYEAYCEAAKKHFGDFARFA